MRDSNELTTTNEIENNRKSLVPVHVHLPDLRDADGLPAPPAESSVEQIYALTLRNSFPVPSNYHMNSEDLKHENYTSIINVSHENDSKRVSTNEEVLF